jgi:hypothetical protein
MANYIATSSVWTISSRAQIIPMSSRPSPGAGRSLRRFWRTALRRRKLRLLEATLSGYTVSPRFLRPSSGHLRLLPVGTPGEEDPPL